MAAAFSMPVGRPLEHARPVRGRTARTSVPSRRGPAMVITVMLAISAVVLAGLSSSLAWLPLSRFGGSAGSASGSQKTSLVEAVANGLLRAGDGADIRVHRTRRAANGKYNVQWSSSSDGVSREMNMLVAGKTEALAAGTRSLIARAAVDEAVEVEAEAVIESPPPAPSPPPRPPRERRMTEMERQADAIVHAVVAVELLQYHGKLGGTLQQAFKRCVFEPALPRLRRLTSRILSAEDYRIDENGVKRSRPSRVHDNKLEKQFTLGDMYTHQALDYFNKGGAAIWYPRAQYIARQALLESGIPAEEDPQAKALTSYSAGVARVGDKILGFKDRNVAHCDAVPNIWVLPVFVDHDRTNHAERQALLVWMESLPIDPKTEGVRDDVQGSIRVYATHTPCISCLSSMCQLSRAFPAAKLSVNFDIWKETKRWVGLEDPKEYGSRKETSDEEKDKDKEEDSSKD